MSSQCQTSVKALEYREGMMFALEYLFQDWNFSEELRTITQNMSVTYCLLCCIISILLPVVKYFCLCFQINMPVFDFAVVFDQIVEPEVK